MEIAKLWTRSFGITDLSGAPATRNHRIFALQQLLLRVCSLDGQEIVDDKIGDITTQPMTRGQVKAEMLSGENPAQRRFLGRGREARERTLPAGQDCRGYVEFEVIRLEE